MMAAAALGDLLLAFARLGPKDDAARAAIAEFLGIASESPPPAAPESAPAAESSPRMPAPFPSDVPAPEKASSLDIGPPPQSLPSVEQEAVLTASFKRAQPLPAWLRRIEPLAEARRTPAPEVPTPDPLFEPRWTRALLSASLARQEGIGPLDLRHLILGVAQGVRFRTVPRRKRPTLRHGAQILMDQSEAMMPFAADQDDLLRWLLAVVGRDRLSVVHFSGSPARGAGLRPHRSWSPYSDLQPFSGTPVLALTDLGIGDQGIGNLPVLPEEWSAVAESLRRHGCPLIACVPYRRERWPPGLEQVMTILYWDRETNLGAVRMALRRTARRVALVWEST